MSAADAAPDLYRELPKRCPILQVPAPEPRVVAQFRESARPGAATALHAREGEVALGQGHPKLLARPDSELGEDVVQMPFDRAYTDEELCSDLRIRQDVPRETGDLHLLRSQLAARLDAALAQLSSGRDELTACALGKCLHADRREHVVGCMQLFACVDPPTLPA